jgi:predicted transglutaminase-like cysteine proteinase
MDEMISYSSKKLKWIAQCLCASILVLSSTICALEFSKEFLDNIAKQYGQFAKKRLISWQNLTQDKAIKGEQDKLFKVNQFFNFIEYQRDVNVWGEEDYWATPLEFVVAGMGDCEDFSLAKYFTLLDMGVADDKLLMMYVKLKEKSSVYNQGHMVLLYYETPESVPLVLDNINKEILPAEKRSDLEPIYGFNGKGLWQAKELGKGNKIGKREDLKRWVDLEERMKSGKIGKFKGQELL